MIDLHFWPTPNGLKIKLFLEEAGLPYRPVLVDGVEPSYQRPVTDEVRKVLFGQTATSHRN